jgi:uncharacterized protein YndB with AHSA1/START domain
MILRVLAVILILIVAVLAYAAAKPGTLQIQRTIVIHAPVERVFALVDDFHQWSAWAPQDREDPSMARTFHGAESGAGAVSEWDSKGSAGKGKMSIMASSPDGGVLVDVKFVKPFQAHNTNEFEMHPQGSDTKVVWTLRAANRYMMKVMGVFVNMDASIGKHLEDGLANLKSVAEQ